MHRSQKNIGSATLNQLGIVTALAAFVGTIATHAAGLSDGTVSVLVKAKTTAGEQVVQEVFATLGAREEGTIPQIAVRILRVPAAQREKVLLALQHNPHIEFAEPNEAIAPDFVPNDPSLGSQWHLPKIGALTAWDSTAGQAGVVVAILDTGVDSSHPDLASKIVPGWNFYDNNSNTSDVYGHGTMVAGSSAATGNNGIGVAGVAWGCSIMPIRISDLAGYGYPSTMAQGLTFAADHGARVANISYAVSTSPTVASAAQYFQSRGGVVTISAGNSSTFDATADNPYVLTVSATDSNDFLTSWSNTGNNVDLSAPGLGITTTAVGGGYASVSGTSFSAPIVAGVAALVISANPALSATQVQNILKQSAFDLGTLGWDGQYGSGRVNAAAAVAAAILTSPSPTPPPPTTDTTAPTAQISSPTDGAVLTGTVSISISGSDDVGVIKVRLYINGSLTDESSGASGTFSWNTASSVDGVYSLQAKAYDAAGNSGSTTINVTTTNGTVSPGKGKGRRK